MPYRTIIFLLTLLVLTAAVHGENAQKVELRFYDIREITSDLIDSPLPEYSVTFRRELAPAQEEKPKVEDQMMSLTGAKLGNLIRDKLLVGEFADPATSIEESYGQLWVMQSPKVHERIAAILANLRKSFKPQVAISGVLISSPELPRQNILDAAAMKKFQEGAKTLAAPRILCFHGQRTNVVSGDKKRYIADYDIAGDSYDPLIRDILQGFAFTVRPTVSQDQGSVDLDLQFVATSNFKPNLRTYGYPQTTSSAGAANEGNLIFGPIIKAELDLPSVDSLTLRSTVSVPKGAWALAGAMNDPDPEKKEANLLLFVKAEVLNPK